jgi:hypothetical protein
MTIPQPDIHLRRGEDGVRLLPRDFFDVVSHRFFPVLSLTYIASIIGIAFRKGHAFEYLFQDDSAYDMALWIALWVSIPAMFWIIIRNSLLYAHMADAWYKAIAGLMCLTLAVSFVLFPEWEVGDGLRMFFVATMPVFVIQYFFFVRGGLPAAAAWPLTIAGIVLFIYGQFVLV